MNPKTSPLTVLRPVLAAAGITLLAAAAGCLHSANDEMTNAVVSGERSVAMEGTDAFFGGKVAVRVTLSRGIGHGMRKSRDKADSSYDDYAHNDHKVLVGSPLPPVTLHLILTNTGAEPLTVTMIDFESDMGNFAIDPESLTLAPGETGEPTAMVSQLGVSSDVIDFKVTLKVGKDRESRTFQVRIVHADPAM
jgi:hypothetical protein